MEDTENDMRRTMIRGLALGLLLCMLSSMAVAEEARGDLSQRFADVKTIEYDGKTMRMKNRLTSILFAVVDYEAQGPDALLFAALAVVDDDLRRITPVQLCRSLAVETQTGELQPLYAAFADGGTQQARSEALLAAVNSLFPEAAVGHHVVLDVRGLDVLDGGSFAASEQIAVQPESAMGTKEAMAQAELDLKARLRSIKNGADEAGSDELMDMFDALSGYFVTDMKSGALVKAADKTERYEIVSTAQLPGGNLPAEAGGYVFVPDADAVLAQAIEIFYEETFW